MHHPVREPHLVDQVGSPVNCLLLRVIDIVECMEDVLDHAVIPVQGERALEHDCRPVHHPGLQSVDPFIPEIHIHCYQFPGAQGTAVTGTLCTSVYSHVGQAAIW